MKSLLKQIYRYTHSRVYRHNENLWPYIKIKRAPQGHISELNINEKKITISDISALQDKFKGDLLLIASGPSVKETDFSMLTAIPEMGDVCRKISKSEWFFLPGYLNKNQWTLLPDEE